MTTTKKKSGGLAELFAELFGWALLGLIGLTATTNAINYTVPRVLYWWDDSFRPWWHDIVPFLIAGFVFGVVCPAVIYGYLRFGDRTRRAIQKRVERRQPDDIPTKPKVALDDDRRIDEIVIPMPKGKPTTEKRAAQLAEHHGLAEFGEPADYHVRFNQKAECDEVVLRRPAGEPVDDRSQIERDLTKIAQEQLPQIQAVKVAARDEAGLPIKVEVHHEVTAKLLTNPTVAETIERTLAAHLGWIDPNLYRMHWDRDRSVGVLEQCDDPLPRVVPFPFGQITDIVDRESKRLYYGINADGGLVYWDLDRAPHSLVAGKTGAGKTVALTTFVVMALLMGWRVIMLDPKKLAFRELDGFPNFERYGDAKGLESARQLAAAIDTMHDLMEARYDLPKKELKAQQRILFVIDETYIGIEALNDLWAEEKEAGDRTTEHPAAGKLRRMSGLAREANIHLLMAIQRADTALMGKTGAGYLRSNLENKITLGPMDSDGAPMMFGRGTRWARMAQEIPALKGRAMTPLPEGVIGYRPAQVWWVNTDDDDILGQVEALVVNLWGRQERLVDVPDSEPATDEDAAAVRLDKDEPADEPAPRPAKKAVARRPRKAAAKPVAGGPEVIGRDTKKPDEVERGDWVRIPDGNGGTRDVRVAELDVDDDTDAVTVSGLGWEYTWEAGDPVLALHIK